MQAAVKTRPTERTSKARAYLLSFKRTTPRKIISEARNRYAAYLDTVSDAEFIPIAETEWYRQMSREMTPARYLKTYREIAGYSQAAIPGRNESRPT